MPEPTPEPPRYLRRRTPEEMNAYFAREIAARDKRIAELDAANKSIVEGRMIAGQRIAELEGRHHSTPNTDFFDWLADRLVEVYGESPNVDFVLSLRKRAEEAAFIKEGWPDA